MYCSKVSGVRSYRDLVAWKKSMALTAAVYRYTDSFPRSELYGLTSQLRRAAVSVPSNIAEGQGRLSTDEFKLLLGHARGSLLELETQVAQDLGYLQSQGGEQLLQQASDVGKILNGLIASLTSTK